ncbi:MAG: thioesterase family protein [Pseudomonadota bacterium]
MHWTEPVPAPLTLFETRVKPEWIDEFEHMNVAHYITVCDQANWGFWNLVNAPDGMEARAGHEYVIVENHVHYLDELPLGAAIRVTTQLLDHDDKRYILFHRVWRESDGALSATNEVKCLGFNLRERRIERWAPRVVARLDAAAAAHLPLGQPDQAGQGIALKKR